MRGTFAPIVFVARSNRCIGGLLFALFALALLPSAAAAAPGDLSQKPGTAGCIRDAPGRFACQHGEGLGFATDITVSPDGKSAYAAAVGSNAVTIFNRNPSTGELAQKAGEAGCISETGAGACRDGLGLDGAVAVAVSPDGKSVYATSFDSDAIAIFDRVTSGPTIGELSQKPGTAGCVQQTDGTPGGDPCAEGQMLIGANHVVVSPDNDHVYVASDSGFAGGGIAIFDRAADGGLTQDAAPAGCISETGTGGLCQDGRAMDGAGGIAVSPDGANVYLAAWDASAVAIFDRVTTGGTVGELSQDPTVAGCVSDSGTGTCQTGRAMLGARDVALSPGGETVYVGSDVSDAVAIFDRTTTGPTTGELTQKAMTAGCISETGSSGSCQDGLAINVSSLAVSSDGQSVYAAGGNMAILDRSATGPTTGELSQKANPAGCVSAGGRDGLCNPGTQFFNANAVATSPDGENVYAAASGSSALSIFDRKTSSDPDCSDGFDNDSDGLTDFPADAGCSSAADTSEVNALAACQDGIDNDGDSFVDFPNDPGCSSASNTSELADEFLNRACDDGLDNESDGLIDFGTGPTNDPGCTGPTSNNENSPAGTFQCNDGGDNDRDGLIDFGTGPSNDPGCTDAGDFSELGRVGFPCDDELDADDDGLFDFPEDPGCSSQDDPSELDPSTACDDGADNDGDTFIDFPNDPGCTSAGDASEADGVPEFTLTVQKAGSGTGTVTSSPGGISCGADCTQPYTQGAVVTLSAAATAGSTFDGWSGAGCAGTASCQLTMDAAKTVTATFTSSGGGGGGGGGTAADQDKDAIPDTSDACVSVAGPGTPDGCPTVARKLSLKLRGASASKAASGPVFSGKLKATGSPGCQAKQKVLVLYKGKPKKVGKAKTKSSGKFTLKLKPDKQLAPGKYYAQVKEKLIPTAGRCAATKSRSVRVGG